MVTINRVIHANRCESLLVSLNIILVRLNITSHSLNITPVEPKYALASLFMVIVIATAP